MASSWKNRETSGYGIIHRHVRAGYHTGKRRANSAHPSLQILT
jgi:hypothetical protein